MAAVVLLVFILVPILEVAFAIQVGQWLGAPATIGLLLLLSALGVVVAKREGLGLWRRARAALQRGELPADGMLNGVFVLVAGVLLAIPGFLTDIVALALLVPPIRAAAQVLAVRRFRRRVASRSFGWSGPGGAGYVRTEVHHVGDVTPPQWRRGAAPSDEQPPRAVGGG